MPHKLNETFCKSCPAPAPGKAHVIYYDEQIPGFGIRVTKAGARAFILNYHVSGRERRITIGRHPAWTAAAARERAKELRREIDQGHDPLDERQERRDAPSVGDLWKEYEKAHLPTLSLRSQLDQRGMWLTYILPELKNVAVKELTSRQVDQLHAAISAGKPTRANRVLEVLRKALNLAIRWEWIERNPADGFRRNAEHPRERYLTAEEYERVLGALDRMPNPRAANAIRLLILTGARRGEVLGLEWQDLDLDKGVWNRPPSKSKDRKRKRIALSNAAVVLLQAMSAGAPAGLLFPTRNGTPMPDINKPWAWLKKETGLPDLRVHDLRHSFASVLISSGETLETIGKLLGHSQHQTTMRYAHLMDDPQRRAANKLAATLGS